MSSLAVPTNAPKSNVIAPMIATASWALGAASKTKFERVIK